MNLSREYKQIMTNELRNTNPQHSQKDLLLGNTGYVINIAKRILEIAKNSTVLRCGNHIGHLTDASIAYESDAAHTNLVHALVNYALDFVYEDEPLLEFSRRVIDEVVLIHDLPENVIGDIPDNGKRNEMEKRQAESIYYEEFFEYYEPYDYHFSHQVQKLRQRMENKSSIEGRLIYTADKVSAIIMMLCYDYLGLFPHAFPDEKTMVDINQAEIMACEIDYEGGILLSELWTIDYLIGRKLIRYDDTGFFTAMLVVITLLSHGKWYSWRETKYSY